MSTVAIPALETDRLILRAPQMSDGDIFADVLKSERSRCVGGPGGAWFPATWPEPDFGRPLYDDAHDGQGYGTEVMAALRDFTWDHVGLSSCVAYIANDNLASAAVATRLGGSIDEDARRSEKDDSIDVWRFYPEDKA
jgi:hypothetical protein